MAHFLTKHPVNCPPLFSPGQQHKNIPDCLPPHICAPVFNTHLHPEFSSPAVKLYNIAQCCASILSNHWLPHMFLLINCNGFGKECIFCIAKCLFSSPEHSLAMNSCVCLHAFLPQTKKTETRASIADYISICWSEIYSSYHAAVSGLLSTSYLATMKITRSDNLYWSDTQSVD